LARDNDEKVSRSLSKVLGSRDIERAEIIAFLERVRESGAIESAMEIARGYASSAAEFLERIPASVHRDKLDKLTKMVIDRTS
jgi:geranylgeranyl pyrophosphate synthase